MPFLILLLLSVVGIVFWTLQMTTGFFGKRYYTQTGLLLLIGLLCLVIGVTLDRSAWPALVGWIILMAIAAYHFGLAITKLYNVDSRFRAMPKAFRALVDFNTPHTEFSLKTADGVNISAVKLGNTASDKAIVVCHGAGRSKNTLPVVQTCEVLATRYDVYTFDFRGHMESGGYFRANGDTEADLKAVLDHVRKQPYKKVAVFGWSIGAYTAMLSAAQGRPIDALVLGAPPVDGVDHTREMRLLRQFRFLEPLILGGTAVIRNFRTLPLNQTPVRVGDFVGKLPDIPVLFLHNDYDYRLDQDAQAFIDLFEKIPVTCKERVPLTGRGHLFDWPNTFFVWEKAIAWLDQYF
jgi:dienelactone hydrolase